MPKELTNREITIYMNNTNEKLDATNKSIKELKDELKEFCDKVDKNFVHKDVFSEYVKANDIKIENNKSNIAGNADNIKWTLRLAIVTLLGIVINFGYLIIKLK